AARARTSSRVSLLEVRGRDRRCRGPSRCRAARRPRTGPDTRTRHRGAEYSAPRCPVKSDSRGGDGPATPRDLLLRRGGELLRGDVELDAHLAGTEHLDGLVLAHRTLGDELLDRDGAALGEQLLQGLQVHDLVLDAERVGEAAQLRQPHVQRDLPALEAEGHLVAGLGALGAATGGLALGRLTTADAGARGLGTGRGAQVVELQQALVGISHVQSTSSNVTRWVTV